jgi:hypothetical protein
MSNYRPISPLTTFSIVLEKCMQNRLCHYLQNNNILVPEQFGFRKRMPIEDAAFKLTDCVSKPINKKKCMVVEYSVIWQMLLIV